MAESEDELPPERDVKDFSFKQMRKIRMFEAPQSTPTSRSSLLAASSKYGLTFVGCPTGLKVVKTETIEEIHKSDEGSMQNVVGHCPSSFVATGHSVQFVGLSADDLTLSVCFKNGNNSLMVLFDVPSLGSTNTSNAKFGEVTLSLDAGISVLNLVWNPGFPGLFAVCLSNGSVSIMEMTETEVKTLATHPGNVKASAICWSPKGKQLVVGHKDGRLTQYSQALEVRKEIDCPELFTDDPHLVTDVLWISTTLFAAVYSSFEDGDCPKFLLISTPKNEPVAFTNFDDIYYAMSDDREPVFYLRHVSEWSLVVSAFSNGLEAAVVGKYGGEATPLWEKWNFEEDGRPSMPLTNNNDESFPMGLAIDFSSNKPFVKGEERLPPAPIMMILSTDGVLCPFYMVNQTPNTNHNIMKCPEPLPLGGQRKAIVAQIGGIVSQKTGGAGPTAKGPLQPGPVSQGTPVSLPVGVFSLGSVKGSSVALPGMPGHTQVGTLSIGTSKQPLGTPSSSALSAFSFASPKQNVPSSSTGGTPISAFSLRSQRGEFTAFKPSQSQSPPTTESAKPSGTPQLVKPMPTSQAQLSLSGSAVVPPPEFPANAAKPTPQPQGFSIEGEQTPSASATTGFQLPGQSVKSEETKKEVSRKEPSVTVLKSNVIEASVSQHIQEAISHFTEEMTALRESVKKMQINCRLTDNSDLQTLKKTTDDLGKSLAKIRDTTKDQHRDIDEDKRKLLEAFEMLEDARIRQEKKNDPRYVQLLKSRALDPVNTKKMSDIRNLHLYLDETLREVNMALDEQWNKENEQKRSIQRPALDEIFKTLKINHKIAQDQGAKLEKITEEMKTRKLLSTSWQRSSVNTSSARDGSTSNPFAVFKEELRSPPQRPSAPISPEKQAQLRSMLQKRRNTPVRRSIIVPSTAAKTPTVKPSKPRAPLLSSTPAVYPSAAVESRKGRSIVSLPSTEQQELEAKDNESVSEESSSTDGDEVRGHKQELKQLSEVSTTVSSSSAAASGLSFVAVTFPSPSNAAGKGAFPSAVEKEEMDVKKPASQPQRLEADESSRGKPTPQLSTTGAFSAVGKPGGSQGTAEAPTSNGFILPGVKEQAPSAAVTASKSGLPPGIRVISSETPPNIAAAMAAINRASAAQNAVQPPSNSNLDPSASIEPVTLVAYKPQTQGAAEAKGHDTENTAAKAIANAALMAATAEAQKSSTKPQCSTEFILKSAESGKPGPPVVTFKAPNTSPETTLTAVAVAPNVTVNPIPVFKPAFGPPTQSSSASNTGGLRPPLSGTRAASPFSQLPVTSVPPSFAPPADVLFNLGSSSGTTFSAPNQLSFSGTAGDVKAAGQITAVRSAAAFSPASVTPSQRVNRNLFASGDGSCQATSSGQQQDKSRESVLTVATSSPAITASSGIAVPAPTFPFSVPTSGSEGFFKNLNFLGNTSSAFGSGNTASGSASIISALMQSYGAGGTGNVFETAQTAVSTNAAPGSSSPPSLSTGTPSENKDMTAASTSANVAISLGEGGVFIQALSESSKSVTAAHGSAGSTLPQTTSIFGSATPVVSSTLGGLFNPPSVTAPSVTTFASTGGLFGVPSGVANTTVTAAPATTVASTGSLFGLSSGGANSTVTAPSATAVPSTSSLFGLPSNAADTTVTAPSAATVASTDGLFGLPSGGANTTVTAPSATTVASTGSLFGLPSGGANTTVTAPSATTLASTGGLFGLPSGGANTTVTAPSATTVASTSSLFGLLPSGGANTTITAPSATTVASTGGLFGLPPSGGANTTITAPSATTVASTGSLFGLPPSGGANTTVTAPSATTVASTGGLFGLPSGGANTTVTAPSATTVVSSGGLFGLPSGGANTSAPPATTTASSLPGLPTGTPSSVTSSASFFFTCINPASTKTSTPTASSPFTSISAPPSTAATSTAGVSLSTSASSGLFAKPTSPASAFGTVSNAESTPAFGSLRSATSTSTGTSLFSASAPTSVFQTPSSGVGFGSPQLFSSSASSQGSTFGSAPVGTVSVFEAKTSFGQSSFAQTTSSGFGVTASKPAENALGFGFGGFGLGGQGTSQSNKTNPFGVTQGFSASVTTQPSLFGGKSGDDIFKSSLSSSQFSQPGFGSQSSGGSFSSQGGSVLSSGFGFGGASCPGTSLGFGSSQPFGSPSAGASVFGGSPSFGSSPAFGGAPAFGGSPQGGLGAGPSGGVFGAGSTGGFGQSSGSPTFGALASHSNIPSFGALAGQSPTQGFGSIQPQQQQTSSFGSFGSGSQSPSAGSFSQWR